jgi:hypothetical protein
MHEFWVPVCIGASASRHISSRSGARRMVAQFHQVRMSALYPTPMRITRFRLAPLIVMLMVKAACTSVSLSRSSPSLTVCSFYSAWEEFVLGLC